MDETPKTFSGVERAAVLMMLVGDDEAAAILQKLEPDEVRQLGKAMFAVADVSENEVETALADFVNKARDRMSEIRKEIEAIVAGNKTAEEKREAIEALTEERNALAEQMVRSIREAEKRVQQRRSQQ